ncbi:MAG: ABC transporter substrate-binding protein [Gammaproteobacteria bacterium]|nr:ABC transporter substrate-binding protein [Gammaproteobacteria bacterium]
MSRMLAILGAAAIVCAVTPASAVVRGKPVHALALYGEAKYGANQVPDYVNANAPKGGRLRLAGLSTFDTFNPFSIKGTPGAGLTYLAGNGFFYEGLTTQGSNEPFTQYCLLCETMELAEDNSWIEYTLRAEAKFHDGKPVTPEDVIFSFETLLNKGQPTYRLYWGDVAKAEKTGPRKVRFTFKTKENAELPLILGQLPVISKAFGEKRGIEGSTLDVPNSTGPYKIASFEPGRYLVYRRDPNYWGKDLVVAKGTHNFDEIRFDYYRDDQVAFEAFKAYQYDHITENTALRWATSYDKKVIDAGLMMKEEFRDQLPDNAQGFVMNLRRAKFQDVRVRQALALAFDFDSLNKIVAYGQYEPMASYFQGSELAATGVPQGEELAILSKYKGKLPDELFTKPFQPPRTTGTGNPRDNFLKARDLLAAAGWEVKNGVATNKAGEPFTFEFTIWQPGIERWVGPYLQNLERLGVKGTLRMIDTTQAINRLNEYDFDMIIGIPAQSISPGNEQREFWGSAAADRAGGRNWGGIKNPIVDEIVEGLIVAKTRESLVAHTRALDRVLLWNWYAVPELSAGQIRQAYWNKFGHPPIVPLQGPDISTWWLDPAKAAKVDAARSAGK